MTRLLGGPFHNQQAPWKNQALKMVIPPKHEFIKFEEGAPILEVQLEVATYLPFRFQVVSSNTHHEFRVYTHEFVDPFDLLARWLRETL